VPPSLPPGVDDRAGSAVVAAALRRVAEQRRQRSRVRKLATALALAAGVVGLGIGAWFELQPNPLVARAESSVVVGGQEGDVAVTDGVGSVVSAVSVLTEGYGVRTEQGSATLAFPSGASARVANKSSLKITRAREKEALFLARGGVDVEVPKLGPARGFSVETPDALVTVHGTRFNVFVESTADGPRTRVLVSRGLVSVQKDGREVFLSAGQAWPPVDAAPETAPAQPPGAPAAEQPPPDEDVGLADDGADEAGDEAVSPGPPLEKKQGGRAPQGKPHKFDSRELADQNERFARAMTAKKNGDTTTALRELGAVLRRYPGSPLSQELRVERLRLLRSTGRAALAAREAKKYLREFPQGYAVVEARELLSEQP
jgi:ferric-dicitrate binding protein FerR (iron transport regulator)